MEHQPEKLTVCSEGNSQPATSIDTRRRLKHKVMTRLKTNISRTAHTLTEKFLQLMREHPRPSEQLHVRAEK